MLKSVEKLIRGNVGMKIGNHSKVAIDNVVGYKYHDTVICKVIPWDKKIIIDDGGWKTSSTTRAINSYLENFKDFEVVDLRIK